MNICRGIVARIGINLYECPGVYVLRKQILIALTSNSFEIFVSRRRNNCCPIVWIGPN